MISFPQKWVQLYHGGILSPVGVCFRVFYFIRIKRGVNENRTCTHRYYSQPLPVAWWCSQSGTVFRQASGIGDLSGICRGAQRHRKVIPSDCPLLVAPCQKGCSHDKNAVWSGTEGCIRLPVAVSSKSDRILCGQVPRQERQSLAGSRCGSGRRQSAAGFKTLFQWSGLYPGN